MSADRSALRRLLDDLDPAASHSDVEFSELSPPGPPGATDPFFTARVLDALPQPLRFTGLSPRSRTTLIVGVHALAAAMAYVLIGMWQPQWLATTADWAHDSMEFGAGEGSTLLSVAAVALVAVVAFATARSHTRTT